ncbi:MAG TPA: polysaccharide biosynthesis/export family protein [Opitutaceae bacterium]|nr:polysaccharide biosynthesis/export family protein [Opitutaceae bacterium]
MRSTLPILTSLLAACLPLFSPAQSSKRSEGGTSPGYRIMIRDQVSLNVFDEPDLSTAQRVDGKGQLRIPLLGNVKLSGMTIRDAEEMLEKRFIEGEFLKDPMVTVRIEEYATREVSVLGAVRSPGVIPFPFEVNSMDIVDVISKTGGLAGIAKGESVRVTRLSDTGTETNFTVNVESLITGRGRRSDAERFLIFPGDVIYVPDRLF